MHLALLCFASAVLFQSALAGSNAKGKAFLEENAKKEGVITLPSGLQYKVLKKGNGAYHPTVNSPCDCHYKGTLIDGTQFDSSYDRGTPTTFAPNQVIKGWTEAMQHGGGRQVGNVHPLGPRLRGDSGSPPKIPGGDTLIFVMEIISINGDKVPALTCESSTGEGCNEKEKEYIAKIEGKSLDGEGLKKEIDRLHNMKGKPMNAELLNWLERRLRILQQKHQEL